MGQHTWFKKDKSTFDKINLLYERLDKFDNSEIYLDDLEILQINHEIDELSEQNETDYHDIFRTRLRNSDNTYTDKTLCSYKETIEFIENKNNLVYSIQDNYLKQLKEFWDSYPNGVIYFG